MITLEHFKLLAAYNRWANARLYAAALELSDLSYRLQTGVYFGSLHGTLNHLLLTDRLWLKRLTSEGDHPNDLDAILYEDRIELTKARIAEDNRLVEVTGKYDETALSSLHSYRTTSGMPQSRSSRIFCCIYSIIKRIIADKPMPAFPSLLVVSRHRWTCWPFNEAAPRQTSKNSLPTNQRITLKESCEDPLNRHGEPTITLYMLGSDADFSPVCSAVRSRTDHSE